MVLNLKRAEHEEREYSYELTLIYHNICNFRASYESSAAIAKRQPIAETFCDLYKISLRSGMIPNYLRYASMLVCTHRYDEAIDLLDTAESMIKSKNMIQCSFKPQAFAASVVPIETNMTKLFKSWMKNILLHVAFSIWEINCIPSNIVYEFYGTISAGDTRKIRLITLRRWHIVEVDAIPLLYYLQYLAHRDNERKQDEALGKFCHFYSEKDLRNILLDKYDKGLSYV
ncbi:hypothetical protein DPMN_098800 [Dreissena polymorpha]|uniref:Uncharacterized protein n=1 Tax=Dreissena polymorpha TaxID=45954 RepID=A0A9D4R729_DREPO|nr:hypothetical protein DPMN_098800 [Dreissena polymorpha]